MKLKNLTKKQAMFVKEYLLDFNGSGAVRRAGFKSTRRPDQMAHELLQKPEIATAVENAISERSKRLDLTADQIVKNIVRLAGLAEAAEKFGEALKAQELLGRHLAMFTDRVEAPGAPDAIIINNYFGDDDDLQPPNRKIPKRIEIPPVLVHSMPEGPDFSFADMD